MVKRDLSWSAKKKAVRQETNNLGFSFDFSFRFKMFFYHAKMYGLISFSKKHYTSYSIFEKHLR